MIWQVLVPIPVTSGIGSVTVSASASGRVANWPYLNGRCASVAIIVPSGSPTGTIYTVNPLKSPAIAVNFGGGNGYSFNTWPAILIGDITVNMTSNVDGTYGAIFSFDKGLNE